MSSIKTSEKQQSARDARCQARFNLQNETNLRFYKSVILDLFQFCFNEMYLNYQFNWSSQKYNEVFEPENAKAFFIKDLMEDSKIVLAFMSELRWKSLRLCLLDEDNGFHLELLSHLNFYERKNIDKFDESLTRSWSIHKDEIDYICSLFRNYPEWKIEWN